VVRPDHLHCLWTLPSDDVDYSTRWRLIKAMFARQIPAGERLSKRREFRGERGIRQRRFWAHAIRQEADIVRHVDYIHFNPVKHGHVEHAADWPYSSFHRYVRRGELPADCKTAAGPRSTSSCLEFHQRHPTANQQIRVGWVHLPTWGIANGLPRLQSCLSRSAKR